LRGWLLDTNVISELRKPSCDPNVKAWSDGQPAESFFLSAVTLAEIRYGIEQQKNPAFRNALLTWLDQNLRPWFSGRILDVDEDVILEWRRLVAIGKKKGVVFSQPDLFIAATAKVHGLTVATRNVADFEQAGVDVINPWTQS
jgi:predicted nucleic acid-binding protein